jgi:hypothetical protein
MATLNFVVEDGTGKSDANSYVSIIYADQYAVNYGYSEWDTYSTPVKQQYLIQGTQYIDLSFNFTGKSTNIGSSKTEDDQALEFPRENMYCGSVLLDSDAVPVQIMKATVEAAVQRGLSDTRLIVESGEVLKREKVGDLEIERFDSSSRSSTEIRYPNVERMIKCLGTYGSSSAILQVRV